MGLKCSTLVLKNIVYGVIKKYKGAITLQVTPEIFNLALFELHTDFNIS